VGAVRVKAAAAGEIDIIARRGDSLVFVEMNTRTSDDFAAPSESVTAEKRRYVVASAKTFLPRRVEGESAWQFDAVEVLMTPQGRVLQIDLIAGAFGAD
jgi:putative endonuclease